MQLRSYLAFIAILLLTNQGKLYGHAGFFRKVSLMDLDDCIFVYIVCLSKCSISTFMFCLKLDRRRHLAYVLQS